MAAAFGAGECTSQEDAEWRHNVRVASTASLPMALRSPEAASSYPAPRTAAPLVAVGAGEEAIATRRPSLVLLQPLSDAVVKRRASATLGLVGAPLSLAPAPAPPALAPRRTSVVKPLGSVAPSTNCSFSLSGNELVYLTDAERVVLISCFDADGGGLGSVAALGGPQRGRRRASGVPGAGGAGRRRVGVAAVREAIPVGRFSGSAFAVSVSLFGAHMMVGGLVRAGRAGLGPARPGGSVEAWGEAWGFAALVLTDCSPRLPAPARLVAARASTPPPSSRLTTLCPAACVLVYN